MDLSQTADLLWQMACVETTAAKADAIEPEHFLAAMTKQPQVCTDEAMAAEGQVEAGPVAEQPVF
jgi:hypothetical protein